MNRIGIAYKLEPIEKVNNQLLSFASICTGSESTLNQEKKMVLPQRATKVAIDLIPLIALTSWPCFLRL